MPLNFISADIGHGKAGRSSCADTHTHIEIKKMDTRDLNKIFISQTIKLVFTNILTKTKKTSPCELVFLCVPLSNCRTVFRAMQEVYEFSLWLEVYD